MLFQPKWQSKNRDEALRAVQKAVSENDQALLCRIAINANEPGVRAAAAEKITDNGVLKRIALLDSNVTVRKAALMHISNEAELPFDGTIGCEHFDLQHEWERDGVRCIEKCTVCGKEREKHTWSKGECLVCGLQLEAIKGLSTVRLSSLVTPGERTVVCNALTYAVKNWGIPKDEPQIKKIITKIANDEVLDKSDVVLLDRVYRSMLTVFSDRTELRIDGMFLLINKIVHNMK